MAMLDLVFGPAHIRKMSNIPKSRTALSAEKKRFIEDVAALLIAWAVPAIPARLYGYLLLVEEPVSLDVIAADLQISKSSASVAARLLEKYSLVRRHGERGSKRVFYGPSDNYAGPLKARSEMLGDMGQLLKGYAANAGPGPASKRLKEMSRFYLAMREAMDTAILSISGQRR